MTTTKAGLIKFDPENELIFRGPYNKHSLCQLKMANLTDRTVAFKVKTTVPMYYTVVPTHGFIGPRGDSQVYITYAGEEKNLKTKSKHKFLVQSTVVPDDQVKTSPEKFWKEVKKGAEILDQKLKCSFPDEENESDKSTALDAACSRPYHSIAHRDETGSCIRPEGAPSVARQGSSTTSSSLPAQRGSLIQAQTLNAGGGSRFSQNMLILGSLVAGIATGAYFWLRGTSSESSDRL